MATPNVSIENGCRVRNFAACAETVMLARRCRRGATVLHGSRLCGRLRGGGQLDRTGEDVALEVRDLRSGDREGDATAVGGDPRHRDPDADPAPLPSAV